MSVHDWEEKDWGRTRCAVESPIYSAHELEVKAGGYCSFHYHERRANRFSVESGIVRVVWAYGWKIESSTLSKGNSLIVPSLVPHQFQVLEDGTIYEEYFGDRGSEIDIGDIVRLSRGGRVGVDMLSYNTRGVLKSDGLWWEAGID